MNEDKIDQNRHLGPWAPLGPSVVPATTSQDAPQSESGAIEQLQQHHQHPDFEETPLQTERRRAKTSEDERRRAFSFSLISLMSWDHGSIDRSTFHHLPASSSTGSYLSIGLPRCSHGIAIVSVDGDQNEASTLKKC